MHLSGCVSVQRTNCPQPVGLRVCRVIPVSSRQGGGSRNTASQALEENTTQSFNRDHEKRPAGPVKWWFGCASRQFASFYRSVIWNGYPRGNLKCWKFNWYCCGAAQSHLHLTSFCWYNHIPPRVWLGLWRIFKMQSTEERVIIPHKISPVFKFMCLGLQLWKLVHQETRKYTRNPHFIVIQLGDSKREVCSCIY